MSEDKCPKCHAVVGDALTNKISGILGSRVASRSGDPICTETDGIECLRRQLVAAVADKEQAQSEADAAVDTMEEFRKIAADRREMLALREKDLEEALAAKKRAEATIAAMRKLTIDYCDMAEKNKAIQGHHYLTSLLDDMQNVKTNPGQPLLDRLAALEADNAR